MTHVLLAYAVPRTDYDGIHDYCASIAASLNRRVPHLASVVLRERLGSWRDEAGHSPRPLSAIAKDSRTSLLALQYNPFAYSRGLAPGLLAELARLRRSSVRLALVVHEPYVNTGSLRMRLLGLGQRGQLRALTGPPTTS